jgi:isopentenyl diphosphate isomerase/L-lactate dehydrogenase-like FMN-dependent dehydrogenase
MELSCLPLASRRCRDRRAFLAFLAGSPFAAAFGQAADVIQNPKEALDILEFEQAARLKVGDGHWAYMASGVDDDSTIQANREGFRRIQLRPRRLVDATKADPRMELWGVSYASPIFLCPTGGQRAFYTDGELAVSRAAKNRGTLNVLSSSSSTGIEDVTKAYGGPIWYQLYATTSWAATDRMIGRVEASGTPAIALTVDNTTGRNNQTYKRFWRRNSKSCFACHDGEPPTLKGRRMYDGIDMTGVGRQDPAMDWAFADRLRRRVKGKLVIKGIETGEDARLAIEHGFDAIWVSNHGGRATETGRSTIEALPEVVAEVRNRVPVFLDGGVRRGTDVFKALALGAKAVGIGRPFLWGLGAFGQPGVERVLDILQGELRLAMGNCGSQTLAAIARDRVVIRAERN